ncbi:MAG: PDGLE domain-containing protein [Candidatus Phosphoribacter sp.]|nr:PDGLE domain-containing protein [Actinomycetales bacterium]
MTGTGGEASSVTTVGSPRRGWPLVVAAIAVILLVAGVIARFASSEPDGLERVTEDTGVSAAALERTGLLTYEGGALIGLAIVLLVSLVLTRLVRRGR